jgi:hypothetical protein
MTKANPMPMAAEKMTSQTSADKSLQERLTPEWALGVCLREQTTGVATVRRVADDLLDRLAL